MSLVSAASTAPSTTPSLHAALPISEWDGVRNYQARNIMSQMKRGDLGFFYHSGSAREIVGIVEVVAEAHPDSTDDTGTWTCVDRSEEHTSELQSRENLVCRLLLEKK